MCIRDRFERTLADSERRLGADHPDTLTSRGNLASAYQDAGRREEALVLFERTLADSERRLGADHPDTLTSRNNLALAYRDAGRREEALPLYERTLADRERVLGADHPALAALLYSIAAIELELSDARSAVRRLTRATAIDEHSYGPPHPEVATDLEAFAGSQQRIGDVAAAIISLRRALDRDLGSDREEPTPAVIFTGDETRPIPRNALPARRRHHHLQPELSDRPGCHWRCSCTGWTFNPEYAAWSSHRLLLPARSPAALREASTAVPLSGDWAVSYTHLR